MTVQLKSTRRALIGVVSCISISAAVNIDFVSLQKRRENLDSAMNGKSETRMVAVLLREKAKSDSAFKVLVADLLEYSSQKRNIEALGGCAGPFSSVIVRNFAVKDVEKWDTMAVFSNAISFDRYRSGSRSEGAFVEDYFNFLRRFVPKWEPGTSDVPMICGTWFGGNSTNLDSKLTNVLRENEVKIIGEKHRKCITSRGCSDLKLYLDSLVSVGRSLYAFDISSRFVYDNKRYRDAMLLRLLSKSESFLLEERISIIRAIDSELYFSLRDRLIGDSTGPSMLLRTILALEYLSLKNIPAQALPRDSMLCVSGRQNKHATKILREHFPKWNGALFCEETKE